MSKYKVGDIVEIRSDLVSGERYDDLYLYEDMRHELLGNTVKIIKLSEPHYYTSIGYFIGDEMIKEKV